MKLKNQLYQLRLYKKGEIEIFQNVINHKIKVADDLIEINYSSSRQESISTSTNRKFTDFYNIEEVKESKYEYKTSFPKETKIKLHG